MNNDPVRTFLSHLQEVKKTGQDQWIARCPAHEDKKPSLSISRSVGGKVLLHCHAGCTPEEIVHAVGLNMSDLYPAEEPLPEKAWTIRDIDNVEVAVHHRIDMPDGEKKIWWTRNGINGLQGIKIADIPLYRTETLSKLKPGDTVVLCEGEKATDAAARAGLNTIGTVGGANTCPSSENLKPLAAFDLVLWPDNDDVGRKHMQNIAAALKGASIRWVQWKDAPPRGDAADTSPEKRLELVEKAGVPPSQRQQEIAEFIEKLATDDESGAIVLHDRNALSVEWPESAIKITVASLKEHSDGQITGNLEVRLILPGTNKRLRSAHFNFSALRTRKEWAKDLTEKMPLRWDSKLEFLCGEVTRYVHEGEPINAIDVDNTLPPVQNEYLLFPTLLKGHPTVLFGSPGTGKSYLAEWWSYLALLGYAPEGMGLRVDHKVQSVLYLDWEGDEYSFKQRAKTIENGIGTSVNGLLYRRCSRPLAADVDQIANQIANLNTRPDLVVIDSLAPAAGGDLNSSIAPNEFFTALRSLGSTVLILAHVSKGAAYGSSASIYGSTFFTALARSVWQIRSESDAGSDNISVALFHSKVNYGRKQRPVGITIRFSDQATHFESGRIEDVTTADTAQSLSQRILGLLRQTGTSTIANMAKALEVSQGSTRVTLNRLTKKNLVTRVGTGKEQAWALRAREENYDY